jgi:hypothetical protein
MKEFPARLSWIIFALLISLFGMNDADGQSVTLAPAPQFVSSLQNDLPNAFGCVFTYNSGTSTPLGTFTDYTGATANANPVILNAGGTANIWFSTGLLYRVIVKSAGGTNCASGSTIYTVDGVNGSLLNTTNSWFAPQTFNATTYFPLSDLQLVFGTAGTQTTLDVPPGTGNNILHTPALSANDTLLSANATQTVTNKNLTTGTQINGCGVTNGAGTYVCLPNNVSTATLINRLAILSGTTGTVTVAPITASGGVVGIVTAGAGISGSATIQENGTVNCIFDGSSNGGDYVQISSTTAGDCHDAGATYPATGQVIGQLVSSGAPGLLQVNLFGPEIQAVSLGASKQVLNAPYTNATTTFSYPLYDGIHAFSSPIIPVNGTATMTCQFTWQASAATAGPKFQILVPTGATAAVNLSSAVTQTTPYYNSSYGTGNQTVANAGTVSTTTNLPVTVTASLVFTSSAGSFLLQAAANGAGTLTIEGGFCIFQ